MESGEEVSDLLRSAQIRDGVGDGIAVAELEQRRQLLLREFFNSDFNVLSQDEIDKRALLACELILNATARRNGSLEIKGSRSVELTAY